MSTAYLRSSPLAIVSSQRNTGDEALPSPRRQNKRKPSTHGKTLRHRSGGSSVNVTALGVAVFVSVETSATQSRDVDDSAESPTPCAHASKVAAGGSAALMSDTSLQFSQEPATRNLENRKRKTMSKETCATHTRNANGLLTASSAGPNETERGNCCHQATSSRARSS